MSSIAWSTSLLQRVILAAAFFSCSVSVVAQHRVITQGKGKLAIVNAGGEIDWEMEWGPIHDIHVLSDGHILVQRGLTQVVEIDPATKEVVWMYDSQSQHGNAGRPVEVHSFQPLANGRIMIAESGPGRIIEIDRGGKLHKSIGLKIDKPHPHSDTRLARQLDNGHYLVCHENDGFVREYDPSGQLVWEFEIPFFGKKPKPGHGPEGFGNRLFGAIRLPHGNTLISTGNGHSLLEVTPEKKIVWKVEQHDLPGITLAWVTTIELLPNGNYVFGNCHAGEGNPLLIEIEPRTKKVVWTFDHFARFGNSVSNSQLLDAGKTIR